MVVPGTCGSEWVDAVRTEPRAADLILTAAKRRRRVENVLEQERWEGGVVWKLGCRKVVAAETSDDKA